MAVGIYSVQDGASITHRRTSSLNADIPQDKTCSQKSVRTSTTTTKQKSTLNRKKKCTAAKLEERLKGASSKDVSMSHDQLQGILNEQAPFFAIEEPVHADLFKADPNIRVDDKINRRRWKAVVKTIWILPASVRHVSYLCHEYAIRRSIKYIYTCMLIINR